MSETPDASGLGVEIPAAAWRWWRAGDNEGFILGLSITGWTVGRLIWQQNVELAEAGGGETS